MPTATMETPTETPRPEPLALPADAESRAWLQRLTSSGAERDAAIADLQALLLRAARFELQRRRADLRGDDRDVLAHQSADDALLAVLGKLGEFRGESRFTTWAYKFALLEAGVKARRRAWQGREVPLEDSAWGLLADAGTSAHCSAETAELLAALREEIETALGARQRLVLVALTLNDVPIDVLAERLGATRGALYKTLHDARRKLRTALAVRGFDVDARAKEER